MDIRYALRSLVRNKGFSAVVVLTLALGIGANTVIFSIVNGVLLRALPYSDPDRLFVIQENIPSLERVAPVLPVSGNHFTEWRKDCTLCSGLAALGPVNFNLTGDGPPERIGGARVSANYFSLLGVQPKLGAGFTEDQDHPGNDRVVIVSDNLWQRKFNKDPAVVGKTVRLDNALYTIIGVLPPEFVAPKGYELNPLIGFGERIDIWKPMAFAPDELSSPFGNFNFAAIVRIKPEVKQEQASQELNAIQARIAKSIPDEKQRTEMRLLVLPMQSEIATKARASLLLLMAAVGAVLLIVCANVANLLLARATGRRKELAIRAALGAARSRLLRQMLLENLVLAALGGVLGFLGAIAALRLILVHAPLDLPRLDSIQMDGSVLAFTALVATAASVLFGFIPAWRASRSDPQDGLRGGRGQTDGPAGKRLRSALVVSEVGISVTLLIAAGLLLGSFVRVMNVDKGFKDAGGLAVDLTLSSDRYSEPDKRAAFLTEVLTQIKALPGVTDVGSASVLPLSGHADVNPIVPDGMNPSVAETPISDYRRIDPDYFRAIGMGLMQGRGFLESDRNHPVVIVSSRTAARLWPGESAIGKRVRTDIKGGDFYEVIGIVGDVQLSTLQESNARQTLMAYLPYWDRPRRSFSLVIRTSIPPDSLTPAVRNAIWRVDPDMPVPEFKTLTQIVSDSFASQQFQLVLVLIFAASAVVLACAGIYGVVAYSVAQKRNEIGIRVALGASSRDVGKLVLRDGLIPVAIGLILGAAGALALGRLINGLLFGISAADPLTYAVVCGVVLASGVLACYFPARTAMAVDPATVLKE